MHFQLVEGGTMFKQVEMGIEEYCSCSACTYWKGKLQEQVHADAKVLLSRCVYNSLKDQREIALTWEEYESLKKLAGE